MQVLFLLYRAILLICFHKQKEVSGYVPINESRHLTYFLSSRAILNSDQGCQFTSVEYMEYLRVNGVRQSMDGKSRWADNIMIERWFRSFKYEEAYLTQYANIKEARQAIKHYIHTYNFERTHSSIHHHTPAEMYYPALLIDYVAA